MIGAPLADRSSAVTKAARLGSNKGRANNMRDPLEFAILGLSVVGSISVAVVFEWIGLWGLMKMMPAPDPALESAAATEEASPRAASQITAASQKTAASGELTRSEERRVGKEG